MRVRWTPLVVVILAVASVLGGAAVGARSTPLLPGPVIGVLEPSVTNAPELVRAGVTRATFSIGWDEFEPRRGQVDEAYVEEQRARIAVLRDAGYDLVLDPGLQYPPTWVTQDPATHFRDQEGLSWRGRSSEDVPDAVWNQEVRAAQARHLSNVADALDVDSFLAVRVGGLLAGELRMPPATSSGGGARLWGFSDAARRDAPSDWRPGSGTPQEALRWLNWYCDSLTGYGSWLAQTTAQAFPGIELQVLFPGWGLRPGDLRAASKDLGRGTTVAERGDTVSSGLDWPSQVAALARLHRGGLDIVIHSTWLDAPGTDGDARYVSPPSWLFSLADRHGLDVSGENTGGGGVAALDRVAVQVEQRDLRSVTWMSEAALTEPGAAVTARDLVFRTRTG